MKNNGYIRLDRCIAESRWFKNVSTSHLFIYLLLKANFEKGVFEKNTIKRGQLVTSLKHLSEDTGLSLQQVRTALKHLKSTHDVTIKTTTKYTIITIKDYEMYAASTHTPTNKQQTNNTQSTNGQHSNNKRLTNKQQQYNKNKKNNKNNIDNKDNKERNDDNKKNELSHVDIFNSKSKFND